MMKRKIIGLIVLLFSTGSCVYHDIMDTPDIPDGINCSTITWTNDILPIMTASCAVTGCHNGISRVNDWRIYLEVAQNAAIIKQKTQDKSMPFDESLSQDQIDMIACWVDEGAQNN